MKRVNAITNIYLCESTLGSDACLKDWSGPDNLDKGWWRVRGSVAACRPGKHSQFYTDIYGSGPLLAVVSSMADWDGVAWLFSFFSLVLLGTYSGCARYSVGLCSAPSRLAWLCSLLSRVGRLAGLCSLLSRVVFGTRSLSRVKFGTQSWVARFSQWTSRDRYIQGCTRKPL